MTQLGLPPLNPVAPSLPTKRHQHLTFKPNQQLGRHGWLRLTPAYSVHLVETVVSSFNQTDVVLDPFCGTGTTALACAQKGLRCDTTDINPFLIWLAAVKCADYSPHDLEEAKSLEASVDVPGAWTPPLKDVSKWWDEHVLRKIASIFHHITTQRVSEKARDLLKVSFCRLAIKTANVSFGHQSMSFKKNEWNGHTAEFCTDLFGDLVRETCGSANEKLTGSGHAILADARALDKTFGAREYNAVVTSPPYPNRMSYIRELRPYMYWLTYLNSGREAGELDWKAIGGTWGCATSNLTKWKPELEVPHKGFADTIAKIEQRSPILSRYVHKYFVDAVLHLRSLHPVVRKHGKLFYVVGNSKFYDVMLHTEEIYASLMRQVGFRVSDVENIRKRSSKRELFEFVVKAEKL